MNVLALDLSTKSSGFAIYKDKQLIKYGCITASSTNKIKRIFKITTEIDNILAEYSIDKIIIEEVRIQQGIQNKTYTALLYMQAAVMFLLEYKYSKSNIEVEMVYPSQWRKKCGIKTGRGIRRETLKDADISFAYEKFPEMLNINDDEADAIAIGWAYVNDDTKDTISWT